MTKRDFRAYLRELVRAELRTGRTDLAIKTLHQMNDTRLINTLVRINVNKISIS